jgi:hypothetical protein
MLEVLEVLLLHSGDGHFSYSSSACQVFERAKISGNSYCFLPLK